MAVEGSTKIEVSLTRCALVSAVHRFRRRKIAAAAARMPAVTGRGQGGTLWIP
jgi:hypothetical protein